MKCMIPAYPDLKVAWQQPCGAKYQQNYFRAFPEQETEVEAVWNESLGYAASPL